MNGLLTSDCADLLHDLYKAMMNTMVGFVKLDL